MLGSVRGAVTVATRYDFADFDCDFVAFELDREGSMVSNDSLVFFNQLNSPDGAVRHLGVGCENGLPTSADDEGIVVDLSGLGDGVHSIAFCWHSNSDFRDGKRQQRAGGSLRVLDSTHTEVWAGVVEPFAPAVGIENSREYWSRELGRLTKQPDGAWKFEVGGQDRPASFRSLAEYFGYVGAP